MKILELNFEKTWRGGERQSHYLMSGLLQSGIDVELLCRKDFPLHKKSSDLNIAIHSFKNVFQVVIFLIANGCKYDVLHAETAQILTYCVLTKPFHRSKVVYTRRLDFVPKGLLTKLKYKFTDRVVAISTAIQSILERFGVKDIVHIPDIVMAKELNKERAIKVLQELKIDTQKPIVATVAAMVQHKDPLTLVACINELNKTGVDFQFVHFGNGVLEDDIRQKVKEYGLQDVYTFAGFQENVEDFFSAFDVFVISSEEEGLGSSVLDAFLYKVPVVGTNAGGLKDLLSDNRAIMCPIKKPDELAAGIVKVLNDKNAVSDMTDNAHCYVLENHTKKTIAEKYKKTFEELFA